MLYRESIAILAALKQDQLIIEFKIDGTIIDANEKFLATTGDCIHDILGKKHNDFIDPSPRNSRGHLMFWERITRGENLRAQLKWIARNGREIWLDASYNPIRDGHGVPFKVVKLATDVTAGKGDRGRRTGSAPLHLG